METNRYNTSRKPSLDADEAIAEPQEIRELHSLVRELVPGARRRFRPIRTEGPRQSKPNDRRQISGVRVFRKVVLLAGRADGASRRYGHDNATR